MFTRARLSLLPLLLLLLFGCSKSPDISQPSSYNSDIISFSYPGNWKITDDSSNESMHYLVIEGPGNVLLIAQIYPKDAAVTLNEFSRWFSSSTSENIPIGNADEGLFSSIETTSNNRTLSGLREKFTITLFDIDVPHLREYYSFESNEYVAFVVAQSSAEDWPTLEPGIDLIISSFEL